MDDLEKRIQETVSRKMNDGTVEKMIEEQMEKAVKTALDDVFGYNGEARKLLKEKFETVMCPAIENHDFNKYVTKLDSVLTEIINNTRLADNKRILDNFAYLMKDEDIKEIKLSEIFEKYCEYVSKNIDTSDLEVYTDDAPSYEMVEACMEVENESRIFSDNDYNIRLYCEKDEQLEMRIKLYKGYHDDYKILLIGNKTGNDMDIQSLRYMSEFEVFLRKIKESYVSIDIDCDDMSEEVEVEAEPEASWS